MQEILLVLAAASVFLIFVGITMPSRKKSDDDLTLALAQFRGKGQAMRGLAREGMSRAMRPDSTNRRYLRQLKQANWYWEQGEPLPPNPKAPFWNLETMWAKKMSDALLFGGVTVGVLLILGLILSFTSRMPVLLVMLAAVLLGGAVGFYCYTTPDGALAGAAATRQRELALEMGFRIPEIRADVLAGNTVQRAIRNMSRRPGGPFVEELRRAVAVLDVTKDDTLAMDQLIERNEGNELMIEFANNLKMVSRQGGQIGPVLNVLADLAQQRLRLTIQAQARKNLQEMTRPIGLSSMMLVTMLIIVPAMVGVMGSMLK